MADNGIERQEIGHGFTARDQRPHRRTPPVINRPDLQNDAPHRMERMTDPRHTLSRIRIQRPTAIVDPRAAHHVFVADQNNLTLAPARTGQVHLHPPRRPSRVIGIARTIRNAGQKPFARAARPPVGNPIFKKIWAVRHQIGLKAASGGAMCTQMQDRFHKFGHPVGPGTADWPGNYSLTVICGIPSKHAVKRKIFTTMGPAPLCRPLACAYILRHDTIFASDPNGLDGHICLGSLCR